jgi:O-antigen ligase
MTYSRTGFLAFFILCFAYLLIRSTAKSWIAFILGAISVYLLLFLVLEYDIVHLSPDQKQRLSDVLGILTGETPQTRYEYREMLLEVGLDKIAALFPWGAGIGSFHSLEFGVRHRISGEWLGVHNTYVMILGEAGLAGIISFSVFWLTAINQAALSRHRVLTLGIVTVILCSMLTTHSVLNDKIAAVMLAFLLAAVVRLPYANSDLTQHQTG